MTDKAITNPDERLALIFVLSSIGYAGGGYIKQEMFDLIQKAAYFHDATFEANRDKFFCDLNEDQVNFITKNKGLDR